MKKYPIMWTAIVMSLALNLWLLARIPEGKTGGGVMVHSTDKKLFAWFGSCRATNPLHSDHGVFGEFEVSLCEDYAPNIFSMRFKPAAKSDMDFRRDATVKWMDGKRIVEATTPYLTLRLDLDALDNYRNRKHND